MVDELVPFEMVHIIEISDMIESSVRSLGFYITDKLNC